MRQGLGLIMAGLLIGGLGFAAVMIQPDPDAPDRVSRKAAGGADAGEDYVGGEVGGMETTAVGGQTKRVYLVLLDTGDLIRVPSAYRIKGIALGERICLRAGAAGRALPGVIVDLDRCKR